MAMHIVAEAALINMGNKTYAKATFLLPGHFSDSSIASYKATLDKKGHYYTVTKGGACPLLRLTTPSPIVIPLPASVTAWHIRKFEDAMIPITAVATDSSKFNDECSVDIFQPGNNKDRAEEQPFSPVSTTYTTSSHHEPGSPDTDYSLDSEGSFKDGKQDEVHCADECVNGESVDADAKHMDFLTSDTGRYPIVVGAGNTGKVMQGDHSTVDKRNLYQSLTVIGKVGAEFLLKYLMGNYLRSRMDLTLKPKNKAVAIQHNVIDIERIVCQQASSPAGRPHEMPDQVTYSDNLKLVVLSSSSQVAAVNPLINPVTSSINFGIPGSWELIDTVLYQVYPGYILHEYKVDDTWFITYYQDLAHDFYEDDPAGFESENILEAAAHEDSGIQPATSASLVKLIDSVSCNANGNQFEFSRDVLETFTSSDLQPLRKIIQSRFSNLLSVLFNRGKFMNKSAGTLDFRSTKDVSMLLLPASSMFLFNRDTTMLEPAGIFVPGLNQNNMESLPKFRTIPSRENTKPFKSVDISAFRIGTHRSKIMTPKQSIFLAHPGKILFKRTIFKALGTSNFKQGSCLSKIRRVSSEHNKISFKPTYTSTCQINMNRSEVMLRKPSKFSASPGKSLLKRSPIITQGVMKSNERSFSPKLVIATFAGDNNPVKTAHISISRIVLNDPKVVLSKASTFSVYPGYSLLKRAMIMAPQIIQNHQGPFLPKLSTLSCADNEFPPKLAGLSASLGHVVSLKCMLKQSALSTIPHKTLLKPTKTLKNNTRPMGPKISLISSYRKKDLPMPPRISALRIAAYVLDSMFHKPLKVFHKVIERPLLRPTVQNLQQIISPMTADSRIATTVAKFMPPKQLRILRKVVRQPKVPFIVRTIQHVFLLLTIASLEHIWISPQPNAFQMVAFTGLEAVPILTPGIPNFDRHTSITDHSRLFLTNHFLSEVQDQPATPTVAEEVDNQQVTPPGSNNEDKYWKLFTLKHRNMLEEYANSADDSAFEMHSSVVQSFSTVKKLKPFTKFLKKLRKVDHTEARSDAKEWQAIEEYVNSVDEATDELVHHNPWKTIEKEVHNVHRPEVKSSGISRKRIEKYINAADEDSQEEDNAEPRVISEAIEEHNVADEDGSLTPFLDAKNGKDAAQKTLQEEAAINSANDRPVQSPSPEPCDEKEISKEGASRSPPTGEVLEQPVPKERQSYLMKSKVTNSVPLRPINLTVDDYDELSFPRYDYCDSQPLSEEHGSVQLKIMTPRSTPIYRLQDPALMFSQQEAFTTIAEGKEPDTVVPRKTQHRRNCSSTSTLRSVTPMETIKEEDSDVLSGLDTMAYSPSDSRSSTPSSETTQIVRNTSNGITEEVFRIAITLGENEGDRLDYLAETKTLEDYCTNLDESGMSPRSLDKIFATLEQHRAVRGLIASDEEKFDFEPACFSPSKKAIRSEERERNETSVLVDETYDVAAPVFEFNKTMTDYATSGMQSDEDEVSSTVIKTSDTELHPRLESRERVKMSAINEDNLPTIRDNSTAVIIDHLMFLKSDTVTSTYGVVPVEKEPVKSEQEKELIDENKEELPSTDEEGSTSSHHRDPSTSEKTKVLAKDLHPPQQPVTTTSYSLLPQFPVRRCFYGSLTLGVNGTKRVVDGVAKIIRK